MTGHKWVFEKENDDGTKTYHCSACWDRKTE